ncbi:MAG: glycosyltransferase [Planctomycetota bacterium]|jgi:glycosyltransferase involved in cell wall biosynthesis|nr:glycosyltransferase [Planctomycetota bacterium]MDP6941990.1 glycosyltransferase [Planctomycetota bacterium]
MKTDSAPRGILGVDGSSYTSNPTGAIRRSTELLPRLSKLGWTIHLFIPQAHAASFSQLEGVSVFPLQVPHRPGPLRPLVAGRALERAFHKTNCQLLLTETPPTPPGIPFVFTLHDLHAWDVPVQSGLLRSFWIRKTFPRAFQEAKAINVVSQFTANRLNHFFPKSKCEVIPNGSDHLPECEGTTEPKDAWLSVGPWDRLAQPKLLQALSGKITIVGNYKKTLPKNATLVRPSDFELARLYKNSRALICTSPYEGFNFPLAEALASGCPAVATDTPTHREVGGTAARYFSAGDKDSLRFCLKELESNPPSQRELQNQAKLFSWNQSAKKMDSLLQRVFKSESAKLE